jgi:hypothetical protein
VEVPLDIGLFERFNFAAEQMLELEVAFKQFFEACLGLAVAFRKI